MLTAEDKISQEKIQNCHSGGIKTKQEEKCYSEMV